MLTPVAQYRRDSPWPPALSGTSTFNPYRRLDFLPELKSHQTQTPTIPHTGTCVDWKLIRHIHLPPPSPGCASTHSQSCTLPGVHFHTESKMPFFFLCLRAPSDRQPSCCHCASVKRGSGELWLSAACHCMCVVRPWGLGKHPSHANPPPPPASNTTREPSSWSWPFTAPLLCLTHVHWALLSYRHT